ncbi:MAG: glycosyl transferase [Glaciihabitans sp.]|nr:glycosyl transferase [Glaciihabitans sp.]
MKERRSGVVSVVLVNFRGTDDTIAAIESLRGLNWPQDRLEIVVVENASGDDSLQRLLPLADDRTIIVESKVNSGFTGGCNLGVSKSSGEFIAFLNNDAKPHPDWITEAMDTFAKGSDIGAVASKVLDWEGDNIDFAGAAITWYGMGYKPHAGETDRHAWDEERDVLFGTGAAMFIRATVFEELEGFDDTYFMFYDDVDLGWRLNLLGYRFRFQPKSLAFHKHHASMNKFGDFRETYLLERNALFTLYKNLDDESLASVFPGALLLAVRRAVARGDLDSAELDLRNPGGDDIPTLGIPKNTMAGIYAIDQFVEKLPEATKARDRVQSTRQRSDRELKWLFGKTDEPAYPIENYLRGYEKIVDSLGQLSGAKRRRILVITGDALGVKMAGPAIRSWNIAKLLAKEHDVRLVSMSSASLRDDDMEISTVNYHRPSTMVPHEHWADVIILQGHALALFDSLQKTQKIVVVDVYDPLHLEQLEQGRGKPLDEWDQQINDATDTLNHQMQVGDFFLAASERQRHFWLGQLAALGRINAHTYSRDTELSSLIGISPFGINSTDPVHTKPALRGVLPGIEADDKIVVWGGGLYNWFDPETLITAVAKVAETHPNIRLFFMGIAHPNPNVPEMEVVARSRALAARLDVTNKNVFFNDGWVDYDERQNYLLEADLGVSTHFQHVETTFSFRTRILDYLWSGLPIVTTGGDSFGDLVGAEKLGAVVPERDVDALVNALTTYLYDDEAVAAARENVARVRQQFFWEKALEPLVEFCRNPQRAADRVPVIAANRNKTLPFLKKGGHGTGVVTPVRYTGIRRDLQRVHYYFNQGGISQVLERVRARSERKRNTQS